MIAGVSGRGGVMLCADSQETVSDYAKKYSHKILDVEFDDGFTCAFAGAGSGPYIDMVIEQLQWQLRCLENVKAPDFERVLERVMADHYAMHVWPRTDHHRGGDVELVAVFSRKGQEPHLFCTRQTAVNWIQERCTLGIGSYLADYLLDHVFSIHGDQHHLLALGAYLVKKARDYIEGCGGESQVILFTNNGNRLSLWPDHLKQLEAVLMEFDEAVRRTFHSVTDIAHADAITCSTEMAIDRFRYVENAMRDLMPQIEAMQ